MHDKKNKKNRVAVIGGGAAGFFSAISAKEHFRNSEVQILEKTSKVLSKVKVSGGGRCNVTHACFDNVELSKFYPRGEKFLRKAFEYFNTTSTIDWFKKRGVELEALSDNCIFPKSNSSQTIIDCFLTETTRLGIDIKLNTSVVSIQKINDVYNLKTQSGDILEFDKVIITTGGQPKLSNLKWLEDLGHKIIEPVPSLFTFNMPSEKVRELMGIVVEKTTVKIEGTKLVAIGPLLITHWGMSGPAILKLSALGARILEEKKYTFSILVNWLLDRKEEEIRQALLNHFSTNKQKKITTFNPFNLPSRLWDYLIEKSAISLDAKNGEVGKKGLNKLVNNLLNDKYEVSGKTTFKEEFVTAGGVALTDVDNNTMESKVLTGMFFAGEILDIDGVTGGFNFQAAWTTAFIAGKNILLK